MLIINHLILEKKLCLNEVRQSVITHEITDSKVLSHKKAHKDAHRRGKETRKNYEYYVLYWSFPFQSWQISSGKREKRVGENLVRRLEWWTHRIMINLAFKKKFILFYIPNEREKRHNERNFSMKKVKNFNLRKRCEIENTLCILGCCQDPNNISTIPASCSQWRKSPFYDVKQCNLFGKFMIQILIKISFIRRWIWSILKRICGQHIFQPYKVHVVH